MAPWYALKMAAQYTREAAILHQEALRYPDQFGMYTREAAAYTREAAILTQTAQAELARKA